MATPKQTALYVDENLTPSVQRDQPIPEHSDREETLYSGTNPADLKHATLLGISPAVLGYDFCGKVLRASPSSIFQPGQIVAGYTPTGVGRPPKYGTHQGYLVCPEEMAFRVPGNLPRSHAACLGVVAMTAADALFILFGLPLPGQSVHDKPLGSILIWDASSSVGLCAVQLARASELGATHCFDYKSLTVVEETKRTAQNTNPSEIHYAFDAVGSHKGEEISATLLARCVSPEASLVSIVVQQDPRFRMPFATPNRTVAIQPPGFPHPITISARPKDYKRAWGAFQWVVGKYNVSFRLPQVDVFEGTAEEALDELKALADNGRGFGNLVLEHPLI